MADATWKNSRGREVPIKRMKTSYILNCILTLEAKRQALLESAARRRKTNAVIERQLAMWDRNIRTFYDELDQRSMR